MRLKKDKKNKTSKISFRCTEDAENKLQTKANLYTEGNISEYLVYAGLNFIPDKNDFEKEK